MGVSERERERETKPWETGGEQTDGTSQDPLLLLIGRMQERRGFFFCLALLLSTQQCVSEFNIQDPRCNPCVCVYCVLLLLPTTTTTKNARTATEIFNEESPQSFVSPKLASFTRDTRSHGATHPIMQNPWISIQNSLFLFLSINYDCRFVKPNIRHGTPFSLFSVCHNNAIKNQSQKSRATRVNFFYYQKLEFRLLKINKTHYTKIHSHTQTHTVRHSHTFRHTKNF
jgi:hypothetical protein